MASFGVALPLTRNSADGFTMLKNFRKVAKQNLKMLILTAPGERVMEPDFGVGLRRFLFQNFSTSIFSEMENKIREQAAIYLPAITIIRVVFDAAEIDRNQLGISIKFSIPDIGASEMLEFTI
tara:strand:+ start:535 stop:903 length:369 start_codon:yes stop_codon:yes gene_type:complete